MKRVVITGIGIISSIGNNKKIVLESLKKNKSGIKFLEKYKKMGMKSHVAGSINIDLKKYIDRKYLRFMGDAAAFSFISLNQAIKDSKLNKKQISNTRTGLIMGSGGSSSSNQVESADILRNKNIKQIGPYRVTKTMGSTISACLSTPFKIKGINYSITSACATSAHCIGNAMEQIQLDKQDIVFAGGGEEEHWTLSCLFDAMGALSTKRNNNPQLASRAYDIDRDGFVIAGGAGTLVLEELEHAKSRNAKIYAELIGYGANSDGYDMVVPSGNGAIRCMKQALNKTNSAVNYINSHGTSTPIGDLSEIKAMKNVFLSNMPIISSTKSITGHSLGGAGVQEIIYSILMLENNFVVGSANIETVDSEATNMPIIKENQLNTKIDCIMSNSFGFGGTNCSLIIKKFKK